MSDSVRSVERAFYFSAACQRLSVTVPEPVDKSVDEALVGHGSGLR
jgi:hypothetical protein